MARLYEYVGPGSIKARAAGQPAGTRIRSPFDLISWARHTDHDGEIVVATFVIDATGDLLVAARRSEHVACAGAGAVLSAGEMFLRMQDDTVVVAEITNNSTGYCPEADSWPAVAAALDQIGISRPRGFTHEFVFRRCEKCRERNLIKDNWYVCAICGSDLPELWNLAQPETED